MLPKTNTGAVSGGALLLAIMALLEYLRSNAPVPPGWMWVFGAIAIMLPSLWSMFIGPMFRVNGPKSPPDGGE